MGSVENKNELKNYLERASLAGEKLLDEEAMKRGGHLGGKGSLYKRGNPLASNQDDTILERAISNERHHLQHALTNANSSSLMPVLQSSTGFRNINKRTTVTKQPTKAAPRGIYQGTVSRPRKDKPYQAETYRITANVSSH